MPEYRHEFTERQGVVWVCDVEGSSRRLNRSAEEHALTKTFLSRFFWLAPQIAHASQGSLLKWTGDGFLIWCEAGAARPHATAARDVYRAALWVSALVRASQLGLKTSEPFRLRHGITYEPAALFIERYDPDGHRTADVIGRAVVLAFRLSGIPATVAGGPAEVPWIVTQEALATAAISAGSVFDQQILGFTKQDLDKYFKGVTEGADGVCCITLESPSKQSTQEARAPLAGDYWIAPLVEAMLAGETWARESIDKLARLAGREFGAAAASAPLPDSERFAPFMSRAESFSIGDLRGLLDSLTLREMVDKYGLAPVVKILAAAYEKNGKQREAEILRTLLAKLEAIEQSRKPS